MDNMTRSERGESLLECVPSARPHGKGFECLDEQTKKLHLAYLLKAMEELRDGEHARDRALLLRTIAEHGHALSACYSPRTLASYPAASRAYRRLSWHSSIMAANSPCSMSSGDRI